MQELHLGEQVAKVFGMASAASAGLHPAILRPHQCCPRQDFPHGRIPCVAQRARIREALVGLPAEQRQVLEMMYYGGKSQSMIAQELELPLGTVKSRTLLGMRRLRTAMEGQER